jgi:hypothetical protein
MSRTRSRSIALSISLSQKTLVSQILAFLLEILLIPDTNAYSFQPQHALIAPTTKQNPAAMEFPSMTKTWHNKTYPAINPSHPSLSAAGKTIFITGA